MNVINSILKYAGAVAVVIMGFYFFRSPEFPNDFVVKNQTSQIKTTDKVNAAGAILVNVDNDAENEIVISVAGANVILKRSKNEYIPVNIPELIDADGMTFAISACDLDLDGRDELLIINRPNPQTNLSHGRMMKYENGKWINLLTPDDPLTKSIAFGHSATCIDRKGNGTYGLAITNEKGPISYLEMKEGKITDIAKEIGVALVGEGRSILGVPGPNGKTNIFVGNVDDNFYFVNQGDGTFRNFAKEAGIDDPEFDTRGSSLIDLNHDDIPDLVYGNHYGPTHLLEQTREGKFKDVTPESIIKNYAVNAAVVGDFNLDGYEDIYLNNIRGDNRVFARHENKWYSLNLKNLSEKDLHGISTLAADLDHNGSYEILNTHGDGTDFPITLYTVQPESQWIKFLIEYENGAIPRGAMLKLRTSVRDQIKVISTGSGRFANYDHELIIGLLPNEKVVSAEVILTSGNKIEINQELIPMKVNTFKIPLPNQRVRVTDKISKE